MIRIRHAPSPREKPAVWKQSDQTDLRPAQTVLFLLKKVAAATS